MKLLLSTPLLLAAAMYTYGPIEFKQMAVVILTVYAAVSYKYANKKERGE